MGDVVNFEDFRKKKEEERASQPPHPFFFLFNDPSLWLTLSRKGDLVEINSDQIKK